MRSGWPRAWTRPAPSDTVRVVKHGPDGATVHSPDGSVRHQPACPVEVVSGLGPGDAFAAGWGNALLRGSDAPVVAAANGAITARRRSCSTAMATEAALRHFLATGRLDATPAAASS